MDAQRLCSPKRFTEQSLRTTRLPSDTEYCAGLQYAGRGLTDAWGPSWTASTVHGMDPKMVLSLQACE